MGGSQSELMCTSLQVSMSRVKKLNTCAGAMLNGRLAILATTSL